MSLYTSEDWLTYNTSKFIEINIGDYVNMTDWRSLNDKRIKLIEG